MALAHNVGNAVEAAYRRGDLMGQRAKLMTAWGEYCYRPAGGEREQCYAAAECVMPRNTPGAPPHVRKRKGQGRGTSDSVADAGFWNDYEGITRWLLAFEAYDKRADKKPLLDLLRSDEELTREARWFLADLLDRQLNKKPQTKTTPAYDRTESLIPLLAGMAQVIRIRQENRRQRKGDKTVPVLSVATALERVAQAQGLSLESLTLAYNGRLGSLRSIEKRGSPKVRE